MKKFLGALLYFAMMFIFLTFMFAFEGCTENQKVKVFGGSGNMNLTPGQKLINVTWKEDNLWLLTRDMKDTDSAETYTFYEESSFGMMEGTYTIYETK